MRARIEPGALAGTVTPPASKSQTHRALIAAALGEGDSELHNFCWSRDIRATADCLSALGASWEETEPGTIRVRGLSERGRQDLPLLDCGESGSTLRFLIPVALAAAGGGLFRGQGRLMERPLTPYFDIFREKGVMYALEKGALEVRGALRPGDYRLPGNVSSQFITGLLLALPLLPGDSRILLTAPLESAGYIHMTLETLADFGISVETVPEGWRIPGNQTYRPRELTLEGDWSQAAFFLTAAFLGHDVKATGLRDDSSQGDRVMGEFCRRLGQPGETALDLSDCPDLAPALAAAAAFRTGEITHLTGAARLRLKESDRLSSVTAVLWALGAEITEHPDGLTLVGKDILSGGVTVGSWNDHRIAMMAAIAATRCENPVTILGGECVEKSYPGFWRDFEALGARLELIP